MLTKVRLIGANGAGAFPRSVSAEIDVGKDGTLHQPAPLLTGRIVELSEPDLLEIRFAQECFGETVFMVVDGWGYRFKSLSSDGTFEVEKNWR